MIEYGNEAQALVGQANEGDPVGALHHCLALIASYEVTVAELRAARREIVAVLRVAGWTLDRVGGEVGRTKQTVAQWQQ